MTESFPTKVTNRVSTMMEQVTDKIAGFGGDPFDSVKIDMDEQLQRYHELTPEDIFRLIRIHKEPEVDRYIERMEGLDATRTRT